MINFLFCTVLRPGASKVNLTYKFDVFLDLTQFFQICPDSFLFEMNDVNNVIWNNVEYHYQLPKVHRFLSRSFSSWPKNEFFCKMAEFFQLQRLLDWKFSILES